MTTEFIQLGLRKFPRQIALAIKRAAAQRDMTLSEFMTIAAKRALQNPDEISPSGADLERDIVWYEHHRRRLTARYPAGTSLAIVGQAVIDHDLDSIKLAVRLHEKFGRRSIFMPRLGEIAAPVRHIRSPHRAR